MLLSIFTLTRVVLSWFLAALTFILSGGCSKCESFPTGTSTYKMCILSTCLDPAQQKAKNNARKCGRKYRRRAAIISESYQSCCANPRRALHPSRTRCQVQGRALLVGAYKPGQLVLIASLPLSFPSQFGCKLLNKLMEHDMANFTSLHEAIPLLTTGQRNRSTTNTLFAQRGHFLCTFLVQHTEWNHKLWMYSSPLNLLAHSCTNVASLTQE